MINERYLQNLGIAVEAIKANKLRSFLTALGIIFGVAAVIAMLAIGQGAKQEILEQMKLVGVNNIVITPLVEQKEEEVKEEQTSEQQKKMFSPGLSLKDLHSMLSTLPTIEKTSAEVLIETDFVYAGLRRSGKLVGVEPTYFDISNFRIERGNMFNDQQMKYGAQVCIIGKGVQTKFFSKEDPIGKYIKCGPVWLQVVGVLEEKKISENALGKLGIRDFNMDIYTPLRTMLIRYKNRSLITKSSLMAQANMSDDGMSDPGTQKKESYHQIDRLVVQVKETELLESSAEVISRMMERRHYGVVDYEITIPIILLEQQQKTKDLLNMVLFAIASISLLVGGIGIMNIMLASVLERIKEIGIRLSIGATKKDIIIQFVAEAVFISITGGLLGIAVGVTFCYLISGFLDITTIISGWSVVISFGVSAITGLVFGIIPAKRAAEQDPIKSLRHE
jgi:putative ABC transport system permease protein